MTFLHTLLLLAAPRFFGLGGRSRRCLRVSLMSAYSLSSEKVDRELLCFRIASRPRPWVLLGTIWSKGEGVIAPLPSPPPCSSRPPIHISRCCLDNAYVFDLD